MIIFGRNTLIEALENEWPIVEIRIARGSGKSLRKIVDLAGEFSVPIKWVDKKELSKWAESDSHQGIAALAEPPRELDLEDLLESGEGTLLLLDGVEDPRNFGAIIRTALAAGVSGLVTAKDRSAPLSPVAVKASAGAAFKLPIARVTNLGRAMESLKKRGFWIYGSDAGGDTDVYSIDWAAKAAVVLGSEGKGLRPNIAKKCDVLFKIPIKPAVESLNVSVSAGVILFEINRKTGRP